MAKVFRILVLFLATAGLVYAIDPSVGVCTRREEFTKRQEETDRLVQQYIIEKSDLKHKSQLLKSLVDSAETNIEALIRYREPDLAPVFVEILKNPKWFIRARALYALKMMGLPAEANSAQAGGEKEISAILRLVSDREPMVREAAANCLSHMADYATKPALEKLLLCETNPYVKASIEAAIGVIKLPVKPYVTYKNLGKYAENLVGPENARRVESVWEISDPAQRGARGGSAFGGKGAPSFCDYFAKQYEFITATNWCYPVSLYKEDAFRISSFTKAFGVGDPLGHPAGDTHCGEDCACFREGCSIYAVADGVVRMIQGAGGEKGFFIAIEHLLPDGSYVVSVYGQCAWDILVKPGDAVKCGQKIATQGLSCSAENGGFGAHLHFGLGDGPFRRTSKYNIGDTIEFKAVGLKITGKILGFSYSQYETNSLGLPLLTAIVSSEYDPAHTMTFSEEPIQNEISWIQNNTFKCKGWLNPQTFLPEHVEPR